MKADLPTYVYVIRCGEFAKVGIADCTDARAAALRVSCPYPIEVAARRQYPDRASARAAERECHRALAGQEHTGEWFRLAPSSPVEVVTAHYAAAYPDHPVSEDIDPRMPLRSITPMGLPRFTMAQLIAED